MNVPARAVDFSYVTRVGENGGPIQPLPCDSYLHCGGEPPGGDSEFARGFFSFDTDFHVVSLDDLADLLAKYKAEVGRRTNNPSEYFTSPSNYSPAVGTANGVSQTALEIYEAIESEDHYLLGQLSKDAVLKIIVAALLKRAVKIPKGPTKSFSNRDPNNLAVEIAEAEAVGFSPVKPGTQSFTDTVNSGSVKWVVKADGELVVGAKHVGGVEISHAVLAKGDDVIAAGQAEIASGGG